MIKKSKIDDVQIPKNKPFVGYPIIFTNQEIRKMLDLAKATHNDVFYDLGCGWGQNLIIANIEYNVKKTVGIELLKKRQLMALSRFKTNSISKPHSIVHGNLDDVLEDKLKGVNLQEATIIFYGLPSDTEFFEKLRRKLRRNSRLVYYYNCLFPEILPDVIDYPFYMSKFPFRQPKSEMQWLQSVIPKKKNISKNRKIVVKELWDELTHDYEVLGIRSDVKSYKKRLNDLLSKSRKYS